tara:strand:+ start:22570 stop:22884 length:315 start_codon:yes stop_codon:yes gene_type:complete
MSKKRVIEICGSYPEGFQKEEIASNPNYVFKNDSNYFGVKVWDSEGNSIFVNSFLECEHYVVGGWDRIPAVDFENRLQLYLAGAVVFFMFIGFLSKRINLFKLR